MVIYPGVLLEVHPEVSTVLQKLIDARMCHQAKAHFTADAVKSPLAQFLLKKERGDLALPSLESISSEDRFALETVVEFERYTSQISLEGWNEFVVVLRKGKFFVDALGHFLGAFDILYKIAVAYALRKRLVPSATKYSVLKADALTRYAGSLVHLPEQISDLKSIAPVVKAGELGKFKEVLQKKLGALSAVGISIGEQGIVSRDFAPAGYDTLMNLGYKNDTLSYVVGALERSEANFKKFGGKNTLSSFEMHIASLKGRLAEVEGSPDEDRRAFAESASLLIAAISTSLTRYYILSNVVIGTAQMISGEYIQ